MITWTLTINGKKLKNCTSFYLEDKVEKQAPYWCAVFLDNKELLIPISSTIKLSKDFMNYLILNEKMPEPDTLSYTVKRGLRRYKVNNIHFFHNICELRLSNGEFLYFPVKKPLVFEGRINVLQRRLSKQAGQEIDVDATGRATVRGTGKPYEPKPKEKKKNGT